MLYANWPAPSSVHALTTTRRKGHSQANFSSLNLAAHVGDDPAHVAANRQLLRQSLDLPSEPIWLAQTHSTRCVVVESAAVTRAADAAVTRQKDTVLAIMTGDCLPIILCNQQGSEIAAIHAGWRGLAGGIIEATLGNLQSERANCLAWIGPAICGTCYATGAEVVEQFANRYDFATGAFRQVEGQWYADLPQIAALVLAHHGVSHTYQSGICTFEANNRFYSYRRASQTGRMATLIWLQENLC